jgi:hypothetical protein
LQNVRRAELTLHCSAGFIRQKFQLLFNKRWQLRPTLFLSNEPLYNVHILLTLDNYHLFSNMTIHPTLAHIVIKKFRARLKLWRIWKLPPGLSNAFGWHGIGILYIQFKNFQFNSIEEN